MMPAAEKQKSLLHTWSTFGAYLFDIDGTLIHCTDAVHYFAFCDALTSIAGRPLNLDGVTAHGNTDIGILRDAFAVAGIPETQWRTQLDEICAMMADQVDRNRSQLCIHVLPGVKPVIEHLRARGAAVGVATGNLERIGKRKLEAAGLLSQFDFGSWSDALESRADVFRRAIEKAHAFAGPDANILFIGDTPADIHAARVNHLPVVAVATGIYTFEQLQQEAPDLCIHSMEELLTA